ncbi:MAG: polysaccharide pyruvyl transferase family protein [Bryobacteraceae bacterium]|nr:polysaccharide pyruvyl transferase family protein [Bryobacteraceae bacterium]
MNNTSPLTVQERLATRCHPVILLYGSGFTSNYGCEAIIRGTATLIREVWPQAVIRYASIRYTDDSRRLKNCPLDIIKRVEIPFYSETFPRLSPWTIATKLRTCAKLRWVPTMESSSLLDGIDAVFSIGGDLYTPGPQGLGYPHDLVTFGDTIIASGLKLIVWGASIGPFTTDRNAEIVMQRHLMRTHLVAAREPATISYLRSLNIERNVTFCPDPAFTVIGDESSQCVPPNRYRFAVNLSPLAELYANAHSADLVGDQIRALTEISERYNAELLLVPHVVDHVSAKNNDLTYLERIYSLLPSKVKARTVVVREDHGYRGAKAVLKSCHLVVASRMHCAINALSESLPTVLLAYSAKAFGIANYVYGHADWCLAHDRVGELPSVVDRLLSRRDEIESALRNRIPIIRSEANEPLRRLRVLLG